MAFVLKRPVGESKGIALFTHKEAAYLHTRAPGIGGELARLRQHYLLGIHWGWAFENVFSPPWVDFNLGRPSTVTFRNEDAARRLPFNSSLFTPRCFRDRGLPKQWDIISVSRAAKFKNNAQLLDCLRLVYDQRPETRPLVICTGPEDLSDPTYDNDLWDRYQRHFSCAERERFTFLWIRRKDFLFPFSREEIAFFYNSSRVFTLFTDKEGVAKVVKEAQLCGLPVVLKSHLVGGGMDFLDERNSRTFNTVEEGADALLEVLEHPKRFEVNSEALAAETSEVSSIPRFREALGQLFEDLGLPFEGELETGNLSRKLPAHDPDLIPARLQQKVTADLGSHLAMLLYLRMVNDGTDLDEIVVPGGERLRLLLWGGLRRALEAGRRRLTRLRHRRGGRVAA